MDAAQLMQLIANCLIYLVVILTLTKSEWRMLPLTMGFAVSYGIAYICTAMIGLQGPLEIIIVLEILKFFIPCFMYYVVEKSLKLPVYLIGYVTIGNLFKVVATLLMSMIMQSIDYMAKPNYIGNEYMTTIFTAIISLIFTYWIMKRECLEKISYRTIAGILCTFFLVEVCMLYISVLKQNMEISMILLNVYILLTLAFVVWAYLAAERSHERKMRMDLEAVMLNQYAYYHSLKEQEATFRKIQHDFANHQQIANTIEEGNAYWKQVQAAIAEIKEQWNRQEPIPTEEKERQNAEDKKKLIRNILISLFLFMGNIPLYAYFKNTDNILIWIFAYNFLVIVLIGLLILWQKKQEEEKREKLQALLAEGVLQKESWKKLDERIMEVSRLSPQNTTSYLKSTGNVVCDAMLGNKFRLCEHNQITLDSHLMVPEDRINPVDMVGLLGNMLDNGIESCNRLKAGEKLIKIKAFMRANFWIVTMENTKSEDITFQGETLKTQKENPREHGYGMQIISDIVSKYDGVLKVKDNGKTFVTQIMIRTK